VIQWFNKRVPLKRSQVLNEPSVEKLFEAACRSSTWSGKL
jgi:hypothetical protein